MASNEFVNDDVILQMQRHVNNLQALDKRIAGRFQNLNEDFQYIKNKVSQLRDTVDNRREQIKHAEVECDKVYDTISKRYQRRDA